MVQYNLDLSTFNVMIITKKFQDIKCIMFDLEMRKMHQNTNARKTFSLKLPSLIYFYGC